MGRIKIREGWQPSVICFACRHAFFDGAETGAAVRIIRVPCAGRVTPEMVLRAFHRGADAVLVAGCAPRECSCSTGAYQARRRLPLLGKLLTFTGLEAERFAAVWPERDAAGRCSEAARLLVDKVRELGPNSRLREEL